MRRVAPATLAILGACVPGATTDPPPAGPQLVVQVDNGTSAERATGYTSEADGSSGLGESLVPACHRFAVSWGEIGGRYAVTVDGETVHEADVPADVPPEGYLVVRIRIGPDGDAAVDAPPRWSGTPPNLDAVPIPGCG